MKAAVLSQYGVPRYGDFPTPTAQAGCVVVDVRAASLNAIDVALAAGRHPLAPKELPVVAGIEGIGTVGGHKRVYFVRPTSPYGSMAETTLVPENNILDVPDGIDDARAAALGNGGMAALMPLRDCAAIREGESVLILGATGVVGQLAVQCASALGAGQIVAAGRSADALGVCAVHGATSQIILDDHIRPEDLRASSPGGFDVVIDYVGGAPAAAACRALAPRGRLVQVGDRAGVEIPLPVAPLRVSGGSVTGFMPTHYGMEAMRSAYETLVCWTLESRIVVATSTTSLHDLELAWQAYGGAREKAVLLVGDQS